MSGARVKRGTAAYLPAVALTEREALRAALHTALGWWADRERTSHRADQPPLPRQSGAEGDDYRRCLALLDPVNEEEIGNG